uniref:Uncharacterized protein n=1 Tax=Parascaris univalens TaxID=6257 RepID=A0A915BQ41_PARUN
GSIECACLHNEHIWWHCRNKSEWRYSYCATCDIRMGTCHEIGDRPRFPCICHNSFCVISDYHLVKAKWPIRFISAQCTCRGKECVVMNRTALAEHCFCVSLSTAHPKCALIDSWEYRKCAHCIWNGECMRSDHLHYEHNCICLKDSLTSCYVVDELDEEDSSQRHVLRIRRDSKKLYEKILSRYDGLLAAYSMCTCPTNDTCTSLHGDLNGTICLCFFNKKNGHVWPCYPPDFWIERRCRTCSSLGDCVFSDGGGDLACVCAPIIRMCVRIDEAVRDTDDTFDSNVTVAGKSALRLADRIIKLWEISSTTEPPRIIKEQEQKEKAFGLKGMSDPIAIKAKASENLIFAVNNLNDTDKSSISYSKQEFITKCSFNGRQCSVETCVSIFLVV